MAINNILQALQTDSSFFNFKDWCCALLLAFAHFAVSSFYVIAQGVSITADPQCNTLDCFWQIMPVNLLKTDLLRSVWHLHAQPPFYNLFLGALVKIFPTSYLQALHAINILLGALLSGMIYIVIAQLRINRFLAFSLAFILAMNPSLFLYEAYILNSLICAFLAVLNIFFISWYYKSKSSLAIYCFIGSMNLLVLTRSIYHVALLAVALVFVLILVIPAARKRTLIISSIICMIPFGWCVKNYFMYEFFGTSSWFGMNLWRIASRSYTVKELEKMAKDGFIDPMVVEKRAFRRPSEYQPYGFNKTSNIGVLSEDDYNNINIPDISRVYSNNAVRLIVDHPFRYTRSAMKAYLIFCAPSSQYELLPPNNPIKIKYHEAFYSKILQGRYLMSIKEIDFGSFLSFLLPIALFLYVLQLLSKVRVHERLYAVIRSDAIMFWCFILIAYTTMVSCLAEYGEQNRFKFEIESIMWVFIVIIFSRYITGLINLKLFKQT